GHQRSLLSFPTRRSSDLERTSGIQKYAELFKITDSLGDLISSYSHGMKQKLALIGAFIHKPKLFVFDEPFVGLDPEASFNLKSRSEEHTSELQSRFDLVC